MINSLNQAEEMLREKNIVHVSPSNREYVEGKQLLDVCGYSYSEATTNGRQKSQARKTN
ncbi:hypothetical protein [Photobacterium leiognathi]|uniref:hypothetical protein n=1 Tax=Photobacterium leiognathi TaxID=553611 RepID=UPI002980B894|nr:hypothetical protein [Photobacterium leiognathi]